MQFKILILFIFASTLLAAQPNLKKIDKQLDKGKYEKAIAIIDKQMGKEPVAVLLHRRGYSYSQMGEQEKALLDFNQSISLDATDPQVFFDRAFAHFTMGKSQLAIKDFSAAIRLDMDFAEAYLNRGTVKFEAGDTRGACDDWYVAAKFGLTLLDDIIAENCDL